MLPASGNLRHSKARATFLREDRKFNLNYVDGSSRVVPTLHIPDHVPLVAPPAALVEELNNLFMTQRIDTESDRRTIIDRITHYVLAQQSLDLVISCEVSNVGEGTRGRMDYAIGPRSRPNDSFMWVMEAKRDWAKSADDGMYQLLAGIDALLVRREYISRKTPIFGVLSNGERFRFFAVSHSRVVYSSGSDPFKLSCTYPLEDDFFGELSHIFRWFTFFAQSVPKLSARSYRAVREMGLPDTRPPLDHAAELEELQTTSFGPRI
jgi:hypothetical protein